MKNIQSILIITLILLTTSFASQYGSISGYVLDENFQPLSGANILIKDTKVKAEADENGYYKVLGLGAGSYTLEFQYIGFIPHTVEMVQVKPDSDTEIILCIQNEGFTGPPPYHNYDGSNAKITHSNPSQRNIDLEKTGLVDIKTQSKCPKLDFARQFRILQNEKEGKLPFIDIYQFAGSYKIGSDGIIDVVAKDSSLYIYNYEYFRPDSRTHNAVKLYHEGNSKFIFLKNPGNVIFENDKIHLNLIDEFEMISEGDIGIKIADTSYIPLALMQQGKIFKAIELYKEIHRSNPKDKYISEKRLKHLFLSIETSQIEIEMKLAFIRMCIDFYPESSFFKNRIKELERKLK